MRRSASPYRKAVVAGVIAGALLVAALAGIWVLAERDPGDVRGPDFVVVIALAEDADGAKVAAAVLGFESRVSTETMTIFDVESRVDIPGTTYDRLKDVYAFGGGSGVLGAVDISSAEESSGWVVLPAETWIALVDSVGGTEVDIPVGSNVFIDDRLFVLPQGRRVLSGEELYALQAGLGSIEEPADARAIRDGVSLGLASALGRNRGFVADSVEDGQSDSSVGPNELERFGF